MIAAWLKKREVSRLRRALEEAEEGAKYQRQRHFELGYQAYYTDSMREPLKWGHLQNDCNWADWHARQYEAKAAALRKQLEGLEQATN